MAAARHEETTMKSTTDGRFIITGAAGGIADAVIETFAEAGARLALVDINQDPIQERAESVGGVAIETDLTDPDAVAEMVREARDALGGIDGLIHTTGGFAMAPAHEGGVELYEKMFALNVRTLVVTTGAVLPLFLDQGHGFLAAFSAAPGWQRSGGGGMSHYAASKAAVAAFLHALQDEAGEAGLRTAVVYPMGVVDTPGNRHNMPDADRSEWIDPREIARALLFAATTGDRGRVSDLAVFPPA
jgi:NADP-dependent 3-hydroxy acid dehydrogenase YdfG